MKNASCAVSAPEFRSRPAKERLPKPKFADRLVVLRRKTPTLRKLLGPSAYELWGTLQLKAHRARDKTLETSLKELAGRGGKTRTVSWCLQRLRESKLIATERTGRGLAIRVLAYDRDEWGTADFVPHVEQDTVRWMNGRRARGRPSKLETQRAKRLRPMHAARPVTPVPAATPDRRAKLEALASHPKVPADPISRVGLMPYRPVPPLLDEGARASTHREVLIELYASAVKVYWPRASVARACKFLRSKQGRDILNAAAEAFISERVQPALWVKYEFDRVAEREGRKTPMRPEVLFEPKRIEQYGQHAVRAYPSLMMKQRDNSEEFRIYREGRKRLTELYDYTIKQLISLPEITDEAVVAVCDDVWGPQGYEQTYLAADLKMREIGQTLEARAANGTFLWGKKS